MKMASHAALSFSFSFVWYRVDVKKFLTFRGGRACGILEYCFACGSCSGSLGGSEQVYQRLNGPMNATTATTCTQPARGVMGAHDRAIASRPPSPAPHCVSHSMTPSFSGGIPPVPVILRPPTSMDAPAHSPHWSLPIILPFGHTGNQCYQSGETSICAGLCWGKEGSGLCSPGLVAYCRRKGAMGRWSDYLALGSRLINRLADEVGMLPSAPAILLHCHRLVAWRLLW